MKELRLSAGPHGMVAAITVSSLIKYASYGFISMISAG